MKEWDPQEWHSHWAQEIKPLALYVHTPLCGTCALARRILSVVEESLPGLIIHAINLNAHPELAQRYQIESVPCLLTLHADGTWNKSYRFGSVVEVRERLAALAKGRGEA